MRRYWQIVLWFFLSLTLAYLPFWFQRRLIFGAHIPLSIMGGIACGSIFANYATTRTRRLAVICAALMVVPLLAATPVYLLVRQTAEVRANAEDAYFVSEDLKEGLKILRSRSKPDDVVFAGMATSRLIPALSGNTVVWGHWAMSIDFNERRRWIEGLFKATSNWDDEKRSSEFWGNDIQFIFAEGALKRSLELNPFVWKVILQDAGKVFENRSVVIYQRRTISGDKPSGVK